MSLLSFLGIGRSNVNPRGQVLGDADRLALYRKHMRAYRGFSIRAPINTVSPLDEKRIKHNFNAPIVEASADFLASKPLKWKIDGDDEKGTLKNAAMQIWDRSGSDRSFLESAVSCGIYGDAVGIAVRDPKTGKPKIEFVSADIAFPQFDGADAARLVELDISHEEEDRNGRRKVIREFYSETGREVFINGEPDPEQSQTWDRIPAVWIRNKSIKGFSFGISDLDGGVCELVEEYDHLASKRTRIVDVYSNPNIVAEGMQRKDLDRSRETVFFIPPGTKLYYLEWQGNQPDVEVQMARLKDDISEISKTPAVALGRKDEGFTQVTGIALRLRMGPLLSKTNGKRSNWGPPLEYLMWLCLLDEGHDVDLEAVNTDWHDPLPQDRVGEAQAESSLEQQGLTSRESSLGRLGVEDTKTELERIERDRRFDDLKILLDAGIAPEAAIQVVGFTAEEQAILGRTDFVPIVGQ